MNSTLKLAFARVLGAIIKSMGFSLIMLMVALSALTGKFPPDWERVKNLSSNLEKMHLLQSQGPQFLMSQNNGNPEEDVNALEKFNAKRAAVGAGLLGAKTNIDVDSTPVNSAKVIPAAGDDIQSCQKKIRDVEYQLFRLQQRVAELEEKSKSNSQKTHE
jgi:hypothetical protein